MGWKVGVDLPISSGVVAGVEMEGWTWCWSLGWFPAMVWLQTVVEA